MAPMGVDVYSEAAREVFEEKLADIGKGFANLPSSTAELQALLQKAELTLFYVWQKPPMSTIELLAPIMKALLADELFQHTDANIRMIHASCMNEVTRIALPDAPYEENHMKKIVQSFFFALNHLSSSASVTDNTIRARRILLVMAMLKACLIVLDLECDQMVTELFQILFKIIRSDHPPDVFKNMTTIMTLMIEDIDNFPVELVKTLLSSIRLDNKEASPMSWELGKTVFEKCAAKLRPHVREAMKTLNLDIKAYADIVSSLCQDAHEGENMVAIVQPVTCGQSSKEASRLEGISKEELKDGAPEVKDGNDDLSCEEASRLEGISMEELKDGAFEVKDGNQNVLEDENSMEALKCCEQIVQLRNDNARADTHVTEDSEVAGLQPETGLQKESDKVTAQRTRGRKPNSLLRPEEGYTHPWTIGGRVSRKVSRDGNKEKKDLPSPSEPGKAEVQDSSSGKEIDSVDEANTLTRDQSRNTESLAYQQTGQEFPSRRKRKPMQSNVKEKCSNARKRTKGGVPEPSGAHMEKEEGGIRAKDAEGENELLIQECHGRKSIRTKRRVPGPSAANIEKEEGGLSGKDPEREDEPLIQKRRGKKKFRDGNTSHNHENKDVVDKMAESSLSEPAKDDQHERLVTEMESRKSSAECGAELVNSRIMVWWPLDNTFYTGTVVSYNPTKKMHEVVYDDDDKEYLDLKDERWELFCEDHPRPRQVLPPPREEPSHQYPAGQPSRTKRKASGGRGGSVKKEAASSSKRSRSEGYSGGKNEDGSSSESGDEPTETYYLMKKG